LHPYSSGIIYDKEHKAQKKIAQKRSHKLKIV
jgi:hypothetical protein